MCVCDIHTLESDNLTDFAIQIINRALQDCKSIADKQIRQQKVALLEYGMEAINNCKEDRLRGKSLGAAGSAHARWLTVRKSAHKAMKRKEAGVDVDSDVDDDIRRSQHVVSPFRYTQ